MSFYYSILNAREGLNKQLRAAFSLHLFTEIVLWKRRKLASPLPCQQRPFDLPRQVGFSRKIEGPLLAGYSSMNPKFKNSLGEQSKNVSFVRPTSKSYATPLGSIFVGQETVILSFIIYSFTLKRVP